MESRNWQFNVLSLGEQKQDDMGFCPPKASLREEGVVASQNFEVPLVQPTFFNAGHILPTEWLQIGASECRLSMDGNLLLFPQPRGKDWGTNSSFLGACADCPVV